MRKIVKILQWARKNGGIVHVSQVERGAACQCVCDKCGSLLTAKKGPKNAHHFAHSNSDCEGNQETLMHLLAKAVIADAKRLKVQGVRGYQEVVFDSVEVEHQVGPYRVDAIGTKDGRRCIVEIAVTHRCDQEKAQYLKDNKLAAVEICLDVRREFDSVGLFSEYVIAGAPRRWISNPVLSPATLHGSTPLPIDHERIRNMNEERARREPEFLAQLRRAVNDRPNRLHFGELVEAGLGEFGMPYGNALCVRSSELPHEFRNLGMVMWNHQALRRYVGRRVGFDVVYDYEQSVYWKSGALFPRVVIRWVEDVAGRDLYGEIGTRRWRRKEYSWI